MLAVNAAIKTNVIASIEHVYLQFSRDNGYVFYDPTRAALRLFCRRRRCAVGYRVLP